MCTKHENKLCIFTFQDDASKHFRNCKSKIKYFCSEGHLLKATTVVLLAMLRLGKKYPCSIIKLMW